MIESLTGYTQEEFITTLIGCIAMILISVTMCGLVFLFIYLLGKMDEKKEREMEQVKMLENGNISPCPYKDNCPNCPAGCKGISWWCGRQFKEKDEND